MPNTSKDTPTMWGRHRNMLFPRRYGSDETTAYRINGQGKLIQKVGGVFIQFF